MTKKISLKDALLGFNFEISGLAGEKIMISSKKGQFVSNGETMTIKAKGLPFYEQKAGRGNIFVTFEVEYPLPSQITPEFEANIDKLLPGLKSSTLADSKTGVVFLEKTKSTDKNSNPRGGSKPYQED